MVSLITKGVRVSVVSEFQQDYSNAFQSHFVFTYRIRIENNSDYTIQLLKRRWQIYDTYGSIREVEGDGVIGLQPIIEPGESHEYVSGCNIRSAIGKMSGIYEMERIIDGKTVEVEIPEFNLIAPFKLN